MVGKLDTQRRDTLPTAHRGFQAVALRMQAGTIRFGLAARVKLVIANRPRASPNGGISTWIPGCASTVRVSVNASPGAVSGLQAQARRTAPDSGSAASSTAATPGIWGGGALGMTAGGNQQQPQRTDQVLRTNQTPEALLTGCSSSLPVAHAEEGQQGIDDRAAGVDAHEINAGPRRAASS